MVTFYVLCRGWSTTQKYLIDKAEGQGHPAEERCTLLCNVFFILSPNISHFNNQHFSVTVSVASRDKVTPPPKKEGIWPWTKLWVKHCWKQLEVIDIIKIIIWYRVKSVAWENFKTEEARTSYTCKRWLFILKSLEFSDKRGFSLIKCHQLWHQSVTQLFFSSSF